MASYTYDVFVSYRRVRKVKRWVEHCFVEQLDEELESVLGSRPKIFWDEVGVEEGQRWREKIIAGLRGSRCIVPILSKPYFQSAWCVAEWRTFEERARRARLGARTLSVPIQWQDNEDFQHRMGIKPHDFRSFALVGRGFKDSQTWLSYERALGTLAEQVARLIEGAPPFREDWPLVDPDSVQIDDSDREAWGYTLKSPPDADAGG